MSERSGCDERRKEDRHSPRSPLGYFGPFPAPIVLLSSDEASGREERGTNDTKAGWTRNEGRREDMEAATKGEGKESVRSRLHVLPPCPPHSPHIRSLPVPFTLRVAYGGARE